MKFRLIFISSIILLAITFLSCTIEQFELTWTKIDGESPSARIQHSIAYIGEGRVILFGGYSKTGEYLSDTWEYDVNTQVWTDLTPDGINPPARNQHSLAYIGNGRVILFGGYNETGEYLSDTWEYDINSGMWIEYNVEGSKPPARANHSMVFAGKGKLLLFGGKSKSGSGDDVYLSDTWIYDIADNHSWTEYNTEGVKPFERHSHSLSFCGDSQVLLFGGDVEDIGISSDTWIYDVSSNTWEKLGNFDELPSKRMNHKVTYLGGNTVVLFGGYGGYTGTEYLSDTWTYNSTENAWYPCSIQSEALPELRSYHSIAYVEGGKAVMFGGKPEQDNYYSDTWVCSSIENLLDNMSYNNDVPIMNVDKRNLTLDDAMMLGDTSSGEFIVSNTGTGSYHCLISSDASWLTIAQTDLTIDSVPQTITVEADTTSLSMGYHPATLTISSDTADIQGSPKAINLHFYVSGNWQDHTPTQTVSSGRFAHSLSYIGNDKALLFGGYGMGDFQTEVLDQTWEYDLTTNTWTDLTPVSPTSYPVARYYHSSAYIGNETMIMFGGYDENDALLSDTWEYNSSTNTWTEITTTNTPPERYSHDIVYLEDGKALLFGGYDDTACMDDTWIYDTSTQNWTECGTSGTILPVRVDHKLAFAGNGKVILFGGSYLDGSWLTRNDTWIYDITTDTWTELSFDGDIPSASYAYCLSYIGDNKIILFNKEDEGVWMLDVDNNLWKHFTLPETMPLKRDYSNMCFIDNGKVLMFGGWAVSGTTRFDDTWIFDGGNLIGELGQNPKNRVKTSWAFRKDF